MPEALRELTNQSYAEFQNDYSEWLKNWEDPIRAEVRVYVDNLNGIMDSQDSISERRAKDIEGQGWWSVSNRQALVSDAQQLLSELEGISSPSVLGQVHLDALNYLDRLVIWLTIERDYVQTRVEEKRIQAVNIIPEINAREFMLRRNMNTIEFIYQLNDL